MGSLQLWAPVGIIISDTMQNFVLFSFLAVVASAGPQGPRATAITTSDGPANPGVETTYDGTGNNGVQVKQFGNELASGYDLVIPHPKGSSTQHVSLNHPGHGKRSASAKSLPSILEIETMCKWPRSETSIHL